MFRPLRNPFRVASPRRRAFVRAGLALGITAAIAAAMGAPANAAPAPAAPPSIAVWLAPYAGGFDTNNNDFNIATHLVLKFPDLVRAATLPGHSTVFLPADYAFRSWVKSATGVTVVDEAQLLDAVVKLAGANLSHIVRYHIVKSATLGYGQLAAAKGKPIVTADGSTIVPRTTPWPGHTFPFVYLTDKATKAVDAKITNGNISVTNGVIHVIDRVMLPIAG